MAVELGIALDLVRVQADPKAAAALARRAETGGLDLVVLRDDGTRDGPHGLDAWTTAAWLAGRTKHIQIGVAATPVSHADPPGPTDPPAATDRTAVTNPPGLTGPAAATDPPGATDRAAVTDPTDPAGSVDPVDPQAAYPTVVAKAHQSLDILAGTRLITSESAWVMASAGTASAGTAPAGTAPAGTASTGTESAGTASAGIASAGTGKAGAIGMGRDELCALAEGGLPVVVPVRTEADVDRLTALAGELKRGGPPRRTAAVRARRRAGIDYDGVPASLTDTAIEPGDPAYRGSASTYLRGGAPGLVLRPRTPAEVSDAVAFARRHRHVPLGVRSGGHGISGRSTNDGGLVIDVGGLNRIEILDEDRRLVRIGPGATWKQVAAALDPYGWALGSGDYGGVGVGGLATAGGIGYLSRKYGLTIDHLRAVELVLADGTRVRASEAENPDLFWAVRGAGANFGVATAFEFEVDELREIGWAQLVMVSADIEGTLRRFGELASTAPRDTTAFLVTGRPRQGQSAVQLYAIVDAQDPDVIVDRLTPFTALGLLAQQQVVLTRYRDVMDQAVDVGPDGHQGAGEPVSRSAFLPVLTAEFARDAARLLRSGRVYFFQLRSMGGAIADTPPDATAFAHRTPAFQVTAMGADRAALDAAWDGLAHHFDGLYLSFDTDLRPERLGDAFPPDTLARLRRLKGRYDPDNLFRDNFNIDPQRGAPAGPPVTGPTNEEATP
ncbi:LLM class flavin-dependent oxidoreductase [Micromonospora sp. WMMD1082]|uniref:LLM class flavin-dependent oxidoreductase n=1 Tax=Micromonospora sp. WMMD1082 TaxID=3016104 RepID=UPI00241769EE|nr:LLM class flavin-dependent oxidoreductase [Micromonospora sp. WMMD1082]MDG4798166.1 LLM class flavin-dependent oxidoreductase [Micromonospora sp. WMMD1082]